MLLYVLVGWIFGGVLGGIIGLIIALLTYIIETKNKKKINE